MYLPYSLAIGIANMYCLGLWNEFVNVPVLFLLIDYFFVIFPTNRFQGLLWYYWIVNRVNLV